MGKSVVGSALYRVGLYGPMRRAWRYLTDPRRRARSRELRRDLRRTRREIGRWGRVPIPDAGRRGGFGIVGFTDMPLHAKFQGVMAKAMQLEGYEPFVFNYRGVRFAPRYFHLFGVDRVVLWEELSQEVSDLALAPDEAVLGEDATIPDILGLQFHGVEIGKHALSQVCRSQVRGSLDLREPMTRRVLSEQIDRTRRAVLAAERFFDRESVSKLLVRDPGYVPNGAIFEVALGRGVDCVVYEEGQRKGTWVLKRYRPETRGEHYFSLSRESWEQIRAVPWTEADDEALEADFRGRYRPDSVEDTRRLMTGKVHKSADEVMRQLQLDPNKKTAIIFSHVAWDATFFFGTCLFDDFEDWLFQTADFVVRECPDMNWIIKLHPFNSFKLQREESSEESEMRFLRALEPLPPNVRIMRADTDVSTWSLFDVADYVLTVNGTVGMEFPCFGIPAVVAGTGRYSGRGFTIDPTTREEYFALLNRLHEVPRLGDEERSLARKHFLALIRRRQASFEDVAVMELKRANEAQSDVHDNLSLTSRSLEEFASAGSIRRVSDWLVRTEDADLLEPDSWNAQPGGAEDPGPDGTARGTA